MLIQLPLFIRFLVIALVVVGYYYFAKRVLFALAGRLARRLRGFRKHSLTEVQGVFELTVAATSHVLFVVALIALAGVSLSDLGFWSPAPWLLVLGIGIGVGEVALSMLVCQVIITVSSTPMRNSSLDAAQKIPTFGTLQPRSARAPSSAAWLSMSRGGWIRHHLASLSVLPIPLSIGLSTVQVACEEIVFRAVLINAFQDGGDGVALAMSGFLFVAMQVFFMQNARAAMFPVVGALIMTLVHGWLFLAVPFIWPLVVAHAVFFFFAIL